MKKPELKKHGLEYRTMSTQKAFSVISGPSGFHYKEKSFQKEENLEQPNTGRSILIDILIGESKSVALGEIRVRR